MSRVVAERLIRFDSLTWTWAKHQENLSQAVRELILKELSIVSRGRPRTKPSISDLKLSFNNENAIPKNGGD